ncbi:hypothetical protein [Prevotella histicola]|nr:hypothetical protein [Prevotella histicola]
MHEFTSLFVIRTYGAKHPHMWSEVSAHVELSIRTSGADHPHK